MAKLYFYYSAMNAGKTTTLLQSNYNYQERGMETLLFIPSIDTRHARGIIASRIGLNADAYAFENTFDFYYGIQETIKSRNISCILVDEAQFLTKDQVMQICRVVDEFDIPVLTYGLRSDFSGEPFEGSKYLLTWADNLIEIKTVCHCGRKAIMNPRVDENGHVVKEGEQILIGGNDTYIALCRKHYMKGEALPIQSLQTQDAA
jgi:thymidine kinase